jgi:hypothetical protein
LNLSVSVDSGASHQSESLMNVLALVFLFGLVAFSVRTISAGLSRPWFASSDEYVVVGEVARFAQLDFHQHFVDMPGTPFMAIGAFVWRAGYAVARAAGLVSAPIAEFTFNHISPLFMVVRAETLAFFALSIVLLFWLTKRLAGSAAAAAAALMVAMSPVYASYSALVRVESLSLCFELAALLCVSYARSSSALVFTAGILSGLGVATRLHSIAACGPILVLLVLASDAAVETYPVWVKVVDGLATGGWVAACAGLAVVWPTSLVIYPHARHLLLLLVAGSGAALVVVNALAASRYGRRIVTRIVTPSIVRLAVGIAIGMAVGMAPVLRGFQYLVGSMEMYSGSYIDLDRAALPIWQNIRWYLAYYFNVIAFHPVWLALFLVGGVLAIVRRDRSILAFLAAALLFFFSKPLNLRAAPHHVILWLPFYAIVCAYPFGVAYGWLDRMVHQPWVAATVTVVALAILSAAIPHGPSLVARAVRADDDRLRNVADARAWIRSHAPPTAAVATTYFCFNADVFFRWMQTFEVPMPPAVLDSREYIIWWALKSQIRGRTGMACTADADVPGIASLRALKPTDVTNPFEDPKFHPLQRFGSGANRVTVFQFDYRE